MILFAIVSFLIHPIKFIRDWRRAHRYFDRDGYPRNQGEGGYDR
jgi:hypothetical protein